MANSISNSDDIIDSRDVIKRIAELEDERDSFGNVRESADVPDHWTFDEADTDYPTEEEAQAAASVGWAAANEDEAEELKALLGLQSEAEGYTDWTHGATLIRDSYFETYARDLAEDLHGDSMGKAEWPFTCIDWEKAARELQGDYTSVDFDGIDYSIC